MRTKIRVDNKWYRPVPWHVDGECDGCVFDGKDCINDSSSKFAGLCDDGCEFSGMIFIRNTKEHFAEYVAKKLEGPEEDDDEV
jgi:hypothetical protein